MPGPPYVTSAGYEPPTVEELIERTVADQRALIDPLIDTDPEEVLGQMNGIMCSHVRDGHEVLLVAYNGVDPAAVEGERVDALMAITGSERQGATASTFAGTRKLTVNLNALATLPLGTLFEVEGNSSIKFETTEVVVATIAGDYLVAAKCTTLGRITVNANTLTVITTPVAGLNSVNNPEDAVAGKEENTDAEALVRRENELATLGTGRPDALRAHLLALEIDGAKPILECTVFENDDDTIDALGLPPHSMECLIWDGLAAATDADAIAQVIWDNKPGGTQMYGGLSGTATDEEDDPHTVHFSRPSQVGIDVDVTITTDSTYAGDAAVIAAWSTFANAVEVGGGEEEEVKFSQGMKAILAVQGVTGIESFRMRRHAATYQAVFTDLALGPREKVYANSDASYCAITVV